MDYTAKLKRRKSLIISQALYDSVRLTGKCRMKDVEAVILSLRVGGIPDTPDFDGIEWELDDAYEIAKMSMVEGINKKDLATRIFYALTTFDRLALPKGVRVRKCVECRQEKVVGEGITRGDYLCRNCRRAVDRARAVERSITDSIRYYERKKKQK